MATTQTGEDFPIRGKIAILLISIVFSLSIYSFMVLEKLSLLDSLYFLVVTVSTVGFGDLAPTHQFTKVVLMLLIITGITTLALLSEIAIDKIVFLRSGGNYDLPPESLSLKNHIVFSQFNDVVERIAIFATDRFFDVVIIDREEINVKTARRKGYKAYLGQIENPQVLELLNLKKAKALYLFLDDDNLIIQSAILAENLAPNLLVYASTNEHLSIEFGKIVGITRTYHDERLLGSFISANVRTLDSLVLPNQDIDDNIFRFVLAANNPKNQELLKNGACIGAIDGNFMNLELLKKDDKLTDYPEDRRILAVYTKYQDTSGFGDLSSIGPMVYDKIIIAGWTVNIRHLVEHIKIDHSKIQYFTFNESDYEVAKANGHDILYSTKENVINTINNKFSDNDLIIINFQQITDSLLLDVMIRRSDRNPEILQIVNQEQEVEVFQKIGVNQVISPDTLTSRAMFQILLTDLKMKGSAIFRGYHLFEHTVVSNGPFHNKTISKIEKMGYQVYILYKTKIKKSIFLPKNEIIESNDRLMLYKFHSVFDIMKSN
ncbi:MAG: hypothetical protein GPJ54_15055 [Candidatus Heimdallarchaeota archaeon]|nr:hypothetical protein [Candidatus Heimdallarchaeota archaeon]